MRRLWLAFAVASIWGGLTLPLVAAPSPPPRPQQQYAGAAACLECHAEMGDTLAPTLHGKSGFTELSDRGCETCHGPAKGHAEDPGDDALIPKFTELSAQQQART